MGIFDIFKRKNSLNVDYKNNNLSKEKEEVKENVMNYREKINAIYARVVEYKDKCKVYNAVDIESLNEFTKNISDELNVCVPDDYKYLLQKTNGIYFGNGIKIFGTEDVIKNTNKFKEMMEDWETSKIEEEFLCIAKYHDGDDIYFGIQS